MQSKCKILKGVRYYYETYFLNFEDQILWYLRSSHSLEGIYFICFRQKSTLVQFRGISVWLRLFIFDFFMNIL